MQSNFSILTVCTGNVCRSPFAEHLLASRFRDIPEINLSSAGTQALVDHPMADPTLVIARTHGAEHPELHRARQITKELIESSDLILAMTRDHRRTIVEMSPRVIRRVFTVREFARLAEVTTDEDLTAEIGHPEAPSAERLRAAVRAVAFGRSLIPPLKDPAEDDVIDPYRRAPEIHAASAQQLTPAVDATVVVLRRALKGAV